MGLLVFSLKIYFVLCSFSLSGSVEGLLKPSVKKKILKGWDPKPFMRISMSKQYFRIDFCNISADCFFI
jgi:hypothetical protein